MTINLTARLKGMWRVRLFVWLAYHILPRRVAEYRIESGKWRPIDVEYHIEITTTERKP
jgi:hypothetical protein